jgi:SHAQKYF class myb-like DNA-binding protein
VIAGRWTAEEHKVFLEGLAKHQKQWKLIADMVKTRTVVQIRTHAQKYFQKLHKTPGWTGRMDKEDGVRSCSILFVVFGFHVLMSLVLNPVTFFCTLRLYSTFFCYLF